MLYAPRPPPDDDCNGQDDDCDGRCDEDQDCCQNTVAPCRTDCNTVGTEQCDDQCQLGDCQPPPEVCDNGIDDDCDGRVDQADPDCP
jgi:hypothetical protein